MNIITSKKAEDIFNNYPENIRHKMLYLRQLVFDTASEISDIQQIEETLKWGEPSYLTKTGSAIRMDWKQSKPDQYAMYFHCKTKLVDTFKELYSDKLTVEGNRALIFNINENVPITELTHCITLALTYHQIKHLPLLGV